MQKRAWTKYFGVLGFAPDVVRNSEAVPLTGWFEIALGLMVLLIPNEALLLFVFAWKVLTELLRLGAGEPGWEFIERFGSYAAPLALFYLLARKRNNRHANFAI